MTLAVKHVRRSLSLSPRSIALSWCFLKRVSECVSPCQSQFRFYHHCHSHPFRNHHDFNLNPVPVSKAQIVLKHQKRFFSFTGTSKTTPATSVINPAHIIYSSVPDSEIEIPDTTLDEYIWQEAQKWPGKVAIECGLSGRKYTYGQCRLLTRRYASALIKLGMKPGEVMAMVLPNLPEFPIAFLGANKAGLIVTSINPQYTPDEIAEQLENADAKLVVTISLFVPVVRAAAAKNPRIKFIVVIGEEAEEGCQTFREMLKDDGLACPTSALSDPRTDVAALPYSSGTTGKPKGVMLTHRNMIANISLNAILFGGLSLGARVVTLPNFDPNTYIQALADHKPSYLHTVPPLLAYVAANPEIKSEYLERIHTIVGGGAPAGRVLIEKILERMKPIERFYQEGYGMTEASPVICMLKKSSGLTKLGSVGTPVPLTECVVIDPETGHSLGPNKNGELYCRGPQVMKGYWKNEEATREALDGEWLKTGDVVYYDEDNHFHVVDRCKELIKVKGFQVAPSELEDVLRKHPSVEDVAVIGIPDEAAGEVPRAYIVLRSSTSASAPGSVSGEGDSTTESEINAYLQDKVAPYKQLKGGIFFRETIPRNPSGKVLRKDLKAEAINSMK